MAESPPGEREAFLSRWSRLKRQQEGENPPPSPVTGEPPSTAAQAGDSSADEQPVLTDADMPPVETLDANSDFSGFMSSGVSEALRRRALRKLFSLPAFNELDGLNDYDEDFTLLEPLGDTITYQMRQWRARDEAEREAKDAETACEDELEVPESSAETATRAALGDGDDPVEDCDDPQDPARDP